MDDSVFEKGKPFGWLSGGSPDMISGVRSGPGQGLDRSKARSQTLVDRTTLAPVEYRRRPRRRASALELFRRGIS